MYSEHGETHRAYHEQSGSFHDSLPAELLFEIFIFWSRLEAEVDDVNAKKKAAIDSIRCRYGKHHAKAVKAAMAVMRKDVRRRGEELRCNEMASRYVEIIESELDVREIRA